MTKNFTRSEIMDMLTGDDPESLADSWMTIARWLDRGDGVAVYANQDLGHPMLGHKQFVSYGSPVAQLETDEPPVQLPDIGGHINWRYQLIGVCREQ